jgi:GT2 family glycosyltransferase
MRASESPKNATAPARPARLGIVFGVRNEGKWIEKLLESIRAQEGLESVGCIAAVDGRSEDASRQILESWRDRLPGLCILDNEARIAPVAFNIGIRRCLDAGAEAVLLLSGHSSLEPGYLVETQRLLADTESAIAGCVLRYPAPTTAFEKASQAFVESRLGRRQGSYSRLKAPAETEIATFPVIRREVFDRVGLFDETMVRNQDIEFTTRARAAGFSVVTSPGLRCRYSPPGTWRRLVAQMYGNGLWVGKRLAAHGLRHFAPALFFGALAAAAILALLLGGVWTWILLGLAAAYLGGIGIASLAWLPRANSGVLLLPLLFAASHGAYAIGTVRGIASASEPSEVPSA